MNRFRSSMKLKVCLRFKTDKEQKSSKISKLKHSSINKRLELIFCFLQSQE